MSSTNCWTTRNWTTDEFVAATCPPFEAGIVESAVSGTVVAGVAGALGAGMVVSRADVSGPTLVIGAADVDGAADVSDAIDVDGSVAGASVSSALPLSSRIPPAMMAASVAPPAMPARRRRIPRARATTAPWAPAVSSSAVPMAGARRCSAIARSSSNGSKSVIVALPRVGA